MSTWIELNILYSMWFISCDPIRLENTSSTSCLSSEKGLLQNLGFSWCLILAEIKLLGFPHTYSNWAENLVQPLPLLVEEDGASQTDDQVRVLLEQRHLVTAGQAGEAWKTVGDPEASKTWTLIHEDGDQSQLPCNTLNLQFVSLESGTGTNLCIIEHKNSIFWNILSFWFFS